MNRLNQKIALPLEEQSIDALCDHIRSARLLEFAQTYLLTREHFLCEGSDDRMPLIYAAGYGRLDQVAQILSATGEKLTREHLLRKDGKDHTPLHAAAYNGHLDQVGVLMNASGEKLAAAHFLVKNRSGLTPLNRAIQMGHLAQVFAPSFWVNQVGEMMELWKHVPEEDRNSVDFDAAVEQAILAGLPPGQHPTEASFAGAVRSSTLSEPQKEPSKTHSAGKS